MTNIPSNIQNSKTTLDAVHILQNIQYHYHMSLLLLYFTLRRKSILVPMRATDNLNDYIITIGRIGHFTSQLAKNFIYTN